MPKKITARNLLGDISKTSAVDIIATVRAVATDLTSQLDKSSATYDVDRYVLSFLEQGIVLDDIAILMLKNFYDTARSTDLVTNKHVTKVLGETFILNETLLFAFGRFVNDTTLIPDSLDFDIQKSLFEAPAANDELVKFLSKATSEIVQIADAKAVDFTKPRTETSSVSDASVRNPNKQPSDTARATEDPNFTVGKATSETARGTDAISLGPNKQSSDTARGTDADTAQFNKLAEFAIVRGTDVSTRQVNKQPSDTARGTDADPDFTIGKNPSDTARGTDADPDFTIGKNTTDTARGTDAVGKDVVRGTTADTSRATDTDTLTVGKNTTDTSSITDSAVRTIVKAVSDFISLSEGLSAFGAIDISFSNAEANISNVIDVFSRVVTYNRTFTETARGTDAVSKGPNKQPSDTARGTDADPDFTIGKNTTDTARGTDTSVREVGKNPSDTARGTDTSVRAVGKNPSDTARGTDTSVRAVGKNPSDTARGTDTDVVDFEKFLGNLLIRTYPEQTLTDYTAIPTNAGEPLTITSFNRNIIQQIGSGGPLNLFDWVQNFGVVATSSISSAGQDNTYAPSPVGGIPLRITTTSFGGQGYYQTFNQQKFNLYPVISLNETWTASIYHYGFSVSGGSLIIYGVNENGGIVESNFASFTFNGFWQRASVTITFTNPAVKSVQVLFATANTPGTSFSYYFDGLQVEKSSVATTFSDPNTTRATDLISQKQVGKTTTPDTARGTDTITQKQVAKTGITDTARGTDADPDLTVGKYATDASRATDAFSRTLTWNRTFTETARGTDTISNNPNKQPSDTARGTDSFSKVVAYSKSYADTARGTDSFSRVVQYSKNYADTARGTDTISKQLNYFAGGDATAALTDYTGIDYRQDYLDLIPKYSTQTFTQGENVATFSNDMFEWANRGSAGTSNCTYSRDYSTGQSPINGIPLRMVVTGTDPHIGTYNTNQWALGPATIGETWTISVYVKADVATTGQLFIFGNNVNGAFLEAPAGGISITTSWTRVSFTTTLVNPSTVSIGYRLDGPDAGGVGQTIWWDGVQLEKASAPTFYKPSRTYIPADISRVTDVVAKGPNKGGLSDTARGTDSFSRAVTYNRGGSSGVARVVETYNKTASAQSITYTTFGNNLIVSTADGTGYYTASKQNEYSDWALCNTANLAATVGGTPTLVRFVNNTFILLRVASNSVVVYTTATPKIETSWQLSTTVNFGVAISSGSIDIAYDSVTGYYVIVTNSTSDQIISARSTNLVSWTIGTVQAGATTTMILGFNLQLIAANGAFYIPSGGSYEAINRSTDGLNWTRALNGFFADDSYGVYYSKNFNYYYAGVSDTRRWRSADGINWVSHFLSPDSVTTNIVDGNDGNLYWLSVTGTTARISQQTTATSNSAIFVSFALPVTPSSMGNLRGAFFNDGCSVVLLVSPAGTTSVTILRFPYVSDKATVTDTAPKTLSLTAGGEGTYVDLDVAGIGNIPQEITQYYNRRNYQPNQFSGTYSEPTGATYNTTSITSGANGPTGVGGFSTTLPSPSVTSGYISFTVPATANYTFDITGAAGGVSTPSPPTTVAAPTINGFKRAPGARVVGTVALTAGQVITMVVGQGGTDDTTVGNNPGGGGGTFVTLGNFASVVAGTDTLLFAAGGGGGGAQVGGAADNYSAGIGQAGTSGGATSSGFAGTLGNGASGNDTSNSTGGGGYFTSVNSITTQAFGGVPADQYSRGFRQGAVGSRNGGTAVGIGGFGGGGSGSSSAGPDQDKGGGGGYSGGGFAFDADVFAGGGGSYVTPSATSVLTTAGGGTTYNGTVQISYSTVGGYVFGANQPTSGTYVRIDRVSMASVKAITLSKAADGAARTKQTEFTPINYTQDLLQIIQPDL